MTKKNQQINFPIDWADALKKAHLSNSFERPLKNVFKELKRNKKITPDINNIFKAFELCKYKSTSQIQPQNPSYCEEQLLSFVEQNQFCLDK